MREPTLGEIEEAFKRHLIETFESDEFGEDEFHQYGVCSSFDYEIDMAGGTIELLQRTSLERDGRLIRIGIHVTADEMPRLITDHPFLPVAGHLDDLECSNRADGTDATYCGETESRHAESTR